MADQKAKVIPGIPLAALEAIQDPNVREVLRPLVDTHHVRNGNSGSGDERFITAKEAGIVGGRSGIGGGNSQPPQNPNVITPAQVSRIINDLQAQVIESQLFKELGERIKLIDKPGGIFDRLGAVEIVTRDEIFRRQTADEAELIARTQLGVRVGNAEAALVTETNARANADNAIITTTNTQFASVNTNLSLVQNQVTNIANNVAAQASQISQVQAQVGNNATAIQQESTARANADGELFAKYSIKIDQNGYVSGYGLMSTANNSIPFSEFIVRADRFAIGSPSGPGIPVKVPFIVKTVDSYVNGVFSPAGTYMSNAFIENGTIRSAQIGLAEIDTLRVAGNAIVVPSSAISSSAIGVPNYWLTVLEAQTDYGSNAPSLVICTASVNVLALNSGSASSILVRICQDNVPGLMTCGISLAGGFSGVATLSDSFTSTAGTHSYQVQVYQGVGSTAYNTGARNITIIGAKR